MRTVALILLLLIIKNNVAQDYSQLGKKISYSEEYKKAKKFKNIDQALLAPEQVLYLNLSVDQDGKNYKKFVEHHTKFINLRKLVIDNVWYQVEITAVPDLSIYKELEFLQLLRLPKFNFDNLSSLVNLKYLEIDGCDLKTFPTSILSLKKLECLNLSLNYLNALPENINVLSNLKELELTNNCFTEIPKQITELRELMYFTINNAEMAGQFYNGTLFCKNKLSVYPLFFADCKKLKRVDLPATDKATKSKLKSDFKTIKFRYTKA